MSKKSRENVIVETSESKKAGVPTWVKHGVNRTDSYGKQELLKHFEIGKDGRLVNYPDYDLPKKKHSKRAVEELITLINKGVMTKGTNDYKPLALYMILDYVETMPELVRKDDSFFSGSNELAVGIEALLKQRFPRGALMFSAAYEHSRYRHQVSVTNSERHRVEGIKKRLQQTQVRESNVRQSLAYVRQSLWKPDDKGIKGQINHELIKLNPIVSHKKLVFVTLLMAMLDERKSNPDATLAKYILTMQFHLLKDVLHKIDPDEHIAIFDRSLKSVFDQLAAASCFKVEPGTPATQPQLEAQNVIQELGVQLNNKESKTPVGQLFETALEAIPVEFKKELSEIYTCWINVNFIGGDFGQFTPKGINDLRVFLSELREDNEQVDNEDPLWLTSRDKPEVFFGNLKAAIKNLRLIYKDGIFFKVKVSEEEENVAPHATSEKKNDDSLTVGYREFFEGLERYLRRLDSQLKQENSGNFDLTQVKHFKQEYLEIAREPFEQYAEDYSSAAANTL